MRGCGRSPGQGARREGVGRRPGEKAWMRGPCRGWDGGVGGGAPAAGLGWRRRRRSGEEGAIGAGLLLQSPPPAAPRVWSLRAPSAEPSLPASRFLRPVLRSVSCSGHTELGAAVPAAASPAEREAAPRSPASGGGPPEQGFPSAVSLHLCRGPGSPPHPLGSWEGRGL